MGDPEDDVIPPSDCDLPRVDPHMTRTDLGDNLSQDCTDNAIIVADDSQRIVPGPSENEGCATYKTDKTSMCDEASATVDIERPHKEAISDESGDSSDIEVLRESPVNDEQSGTDRTQYSADDLNTRVGTEQSVDTDETRSSMDRASYDNDDQTTLKSDSLTYSTSGKVASEQSTDSESYVGGSDRGSHVTSSESECDTYNVQQGESQTTESVSQNDDLRLGSNTDNQCDVNSLEDAEALISDASVRPRSLSLLKQGHCKEKPRRSKRGSESSSQSGYSGSSSTDALIEAASSVPLQGTITHEGDMIAFVAEDLNSMIKMSSPLSRTDDSSNASLSGKRTPRSASFGSMSSSASGWSVSASSASGWSYSAMSRSPSIVTQSPDDVPPIDPRVVDDLEMHANKVAENLHHMMSTLRNHMQKMSAVTYSCLDVYGQSVDNTCNCVDSSIKSMYALMAKNEELAREMQPVNALHEQMQLELAKAKRKRRAEKSNSQSIRKKKSKI